MRTRRRRSTTLAAAGLLAAVGATVAVYFQPHKLVLDDTVREPFPVSVAAAERAAAAPPADQTCTIPSGTDLAGYRSAIVWCRRFSYVFAAAPRIPR